MTCKLCYGQKVIWAIDNDFKVVGCIECFKCNKNE